MNTLEFIVEMRWVAFFIIVALLMYRMVWSARKEVVDKSIEKITAELRKKPEFWTGIKKAIIEELKESRND